MITISRTRLWGISRRITGRVYLPLPLILSHQPVRTLVSSPSDDSTFNYDATFKNSRVDFRPGRIILLRHGESLGNTDEEAYVETPDWCIPLTERGRQQAATAGAGLKEMIGDSGKVVFYYSPYERTRETLNIIKDSLCDDSIVSFHEEPRISEQQFGNFQNVDDVVRAKSERHRFGRFYYRFPSGEAGLDVYSRVSSFISTLVRDCHQFKNHGFDLENMNIVIVTHGLTLRLFLMRWFQFSVKEFEQTENPDNARLYVLKKQISSNGRHKWYELEEEGREALNLPESCGIPKNVLLYRLRNNLKRDK